MNSLTNKIIHRFFFCLTHGLLSFSVSKTKRKKKSHLFNLSPKRLHSSLNNSLKNILCVCVADLKGR